MVVEKSLSCPQLVSLLSKTLLCGPMIPPSRKTNVEIFDVVCHIYQKLPCVYVGLTNMHRRMFVRWFVALIGCVFQQRSSEVKYVPRLLPKRAEADPAVEGRIEARCV
jgi:hypothetical protein